MDWLAAYPLLKEAFGPVLALVLIAAGGFCIYLLQRIPQRMAGADSDGQIEALNVYKGLLESERAAKVLAEQRADVFAKERNDALQSVWELKGELRALNEELSRLRGLVETQNTELAGLRDQVRALKEQINANQH